MELIDVLTKLPDELDSLSARSVRLLAEFGFFAVLLGSVMLLVGFVAFAAGVGDPYVVD